MTDTTELEKLLAEGNEAADFIRTYVVQAKLNERGNYGKALLVTDRLVKDGRCANCPFLCKVKQVVGSGAAMQVEPQHVDSVAEEAALRPQR